MIDPGVVKIQIKVLIFFAQILMDDVIWNGHVEIHLKSSDWIWFTGTTKVKLSKHCIACFGFTTRKSSIKVNTSCLELKNYVDTELLDRYKILIRINLVQLHAIRL